MKIGVLCVQGAVREHVGALEKCGVEVECVKKKEQFSGLDGLVIPGGESTTIGKLLERYDLISVIKEMAVAGKPIYGTCAGLILLSRQVDSNQVILGLMDITVLRNAYGRQRESFEADIKIPVLGEVPYRAVFIRAPRIVGCGEGVEVLATYQEQIVAARQGNLLVSSFHPELTGDTRMHRYFLSIAQ